MWVLLVPHIPLQVSGYFMIKHQILVYCMFIGYRDFDPGPYTAFFPALTTTSSFNIIIFDNHSFEGYETFNLTIHPPGYVFQGDPSQVTVTILDHKGLSFIYKIYHCVKA